MKIQNYTIGIWGFGRVGKSAAAFFHRRGARVIIYDDNPAQLSTTPYLTAPSLTALFNTADYILPSPGIDKRPYYSTYQGQWLCEVDLMETYFKKPIIAITGSVGKTTVTHLLAHLLKHSGLNVIAAGNIGNPMLDIVEQQDQLDMLVLELSSFQLEYAQSFAPHLALWTNLYPNHLDRHGSFENYFAAKLPIVQQQKQHQKTLVPLDLAPLFASHRIKHNLSYFSTTCDAAATFCLDTDHQQFHHHPSGHAIAIDQFAPTTFLQNWLTIWAAFYLLKIPYPTHSSVQALEHRLEKITEINGIPFYNDSKSTTPTSTLAALEQFKSQRIVLFLGGLSKGIDRTPFIQALQSYAVHVVCFGKEAPMLKAMCDLFTISCTDFTNLSDAFTASTPLFCTHDCVLFSPSGSSYDLFANYEERGSLFKKLVHEYKNTVS